MNANSVLYMKKFIEPNLKKDFLQTHATIELHRLLPTIFDTNINSLIRIPYNNQKTHCSKDDPISTH